MFIRLPYENRSRIHLYDTSTTLTMPVRMASTRSDAVAGAGMHIAVIGTGIVGACAAAWLQRDGHQVTFIDPREAGEAWSFGNAGPLSPGDCLPVGLAGRVKQR